MLALNYDHEAATRASIRVLLIDDSPDDAALIIRKLKHDGINAEITVVENFDTLEQELTQSSWDVIISDYSLRSFNALKCLHLYKRLGLDIPFILVSGTVGEETAVEVMKAGAHDYIMKDRLHRLAPAINRELSDAQVRKNNREAQEALYVLAHRDPATGLSNRVDFLRRLSEASHQSNRGELAIFVLELPDLARVASVFGQTTYESAVAVVAKRLQDCLPSAISQARVGDHTFALATVIPRSRLDTACQSILESVLKPFPLGFFTLHLDVHLGVASQKDPETDPQHTFQHATFAVRQAYRDHRPYSMYQAAREEEESNLMALMGELATAIDTSQIQLHYQPYLDLADGSIAGVEGLVRWQHPKHGLIMPQAFLHMAEQSELIHPLTRKIVHEAIRQELEWIRSGSPMEISINLSIRNLPEKSLSGMIAGQVSDAGLPADFFVFEITESMFMDHFTESRYSLMKLHESGFRIAIDDFGTGYSALAYLKQLPIDRIKIDRTFIMDLVNNETDQAIVNTLIDLAHRLNYEIVAEGVESKAALEHLARLGCDKAQGYFYTPPLAADALMDWIRKTKRTVSRRTRP